MKITKRQLKRIIREEKQSLLLEGGFGGTLWQEALDQFEGHFQDLKDEVAGESDYQANMVVDQQSGSVVTYLAYEILEPKLTGLYEDFPGDLLEEMALLVVEEAAEEFLTMVQGGEIT